MDPYEVSSKAQGSTWGSRNVCTSPTNNICSGPDPRWDNFRDNLGALLGYANAKIDLEKMTPQPGLSSTGQCLANAVATGAEYLVYAAQGGQFTLDLSATTRTLTAEWFDPATLTTQSGGSVQGGSKAQSFQSPISATDDAVLYLFDSAGHA
jgi:hypothetical protein